MLFLSDLQQEPADSCVEEEPKMIPTIFSWRPTTHPSFKRIIAEAIKNHLLIEVELPDIKNHPPIESPKEKIPFFGSRHPRKENTWVISLFVVLHLVTFLVTMLVNDCPRKSHGDCILKSLRRFSFQPLAENPLLGPSSSTLNEIGAIQRTQVMQQHQQWRLATSLWLHAGVIHLIVNLSSVILVGIRLEQDFGPLRIGMIYILSAFLGSLISAIFIQNSPAVGSSGALFGLLGAMLSALIQNWGAYANKFVALASLFLIAIINFVLGLLPHVDNFSNVGAFLSGILLGFGLLFNLQLRCLEPKIGIFDYGAKSSMTPKQKLKQKLDKPALRISSLALFALIFVASLSTSFRGVDANKYCNWCHHINCVPSKMWSCNDKEVLCEVKYSNPEKVRLFWLLFFIFMGGLLYLKVCVIKS